MKRFAKERQAARSGTVNQTKKKGMASATPFRVTSYGLRYPSRFLNSAFKAGATSYRSPTTP